MPNFLYTVYFFKMLNVSKISVFSIVYIYCAILFLPENLLLN